MDGPTSRGCFGQRVFSRMRDRVNILFNLGYSMGIHGITDCWFQAVLGLSKCSPVCPRQPIFRWGLEIVLIAGRWHPQHHGSFASHAQPSVPRKLQLVGGTHFRTYALERNGSISANCNVPNALLHCDQPNQYIQQIIKTTKYLCKSWSAGKFADKWVCSTIFLASLLE
jgi:hypothetical protein